MKLCLKIVTPLLFLSISISAYSQQQKCYISGLVTDTSGAPLQLVNIGLSNSQLGTFSDQSGRYMLITDVDNLEHTIEVSSIGYKSVSANFKAISDTITLNFILNEEITGIRDVTVRGAYQSKEATMQRIPVRDLFSVPSASSSVETLIKTLPGVNSGNELSNRYSVRGGSYDENLVYLNDIEIYRPTLVHSGREEGLSIINPDMLGSIEFSSGGFNSSYGDKMASVLDIKYRQPTSFKGSVSAGLLTSSVYLEGLTLDNRLSYLTGVRYKTNRFLLGTLDTRGDYKPSFYDLQALINYKITNTIDLSLLVTQSINQYTFIPRSQRSSFGNFLEAYQLYVSYEGYENDNYTNSNIALSLKLSPESGPVSKFILHRYNANEKETYDIRGTYALNLLDKDIGSENFGDSLLNIGTGSWLDHARNYLKGSTVALAYKSRWEQNRNILSWGTTIKIESVNDRFREWRKIDSTGYSLPYSTGELLLAKFSTSDNSLPIRKIESYILDNYTINKNGHTLIFTAGARLTHYSLNGELLISPRVSVYWNPPSSKHTLYSSYGIYYQTPSYREMRSPDGVLNRKVESQKSIHYVAGYIYNFDLGTTPLQLRTELFYKDFYNLIPYKYDNVRVIYSARNSAMGRAKGIDFRLNGEFVKDAESWISISLLDIRHDILYDNYPAFPAPSDVRFSTHIFFQDYFPSNPTIRAHINLQFSTGVPVSSPYNNRYDSYQRMPSYRRVDIGFSKIISHEGVKHNIKLPLWIESIIVGVEIFNLIDISNTVSYNWLTTVNNLNGETREFAVPNYLTGRSLNLKLAISF